jgi:hypothetical protein
MQQQSNLDRIAHLLKQLRKLPHYEGTARILSIPNILITGQTEEQIEIQIRKELENPAQNCRSFVGKTLKELHVSILRTEEEIKPVSIMQTMSLPQGGTEYCSGLLEQLERQNQDVELMDQAASRPLYNKSFKMQPEAAAGDA